MELRLVKQLGHLGDEEELLKRKNGAFTVHYTKTFAVIPQSDIPNLSMLMLISALF